LVVYHNKYATVQGWIGTSVGYSVKRVDDSDRVLVRKSLGEGLGLHNQDDYFCIFRDHLSGLEYIRNSRELHEKGLYVELGAYKRHVFLDFREVQDNVWHHYAHLTAHLDGRAAPSVEEALRETFLQPLHQAFKELVNAATFRRWMDARLIETAQELDEALLEEAEQKTVHLLQEIGQFTGATGDKAALAREMRLELEALLQLPLLGSRAPWSESEEFKAVAEYLTAELNADPFIWGCLLGWCCVHSLGKIAGETGFEGQSRSWIDEWLLGKVLAGALQDLGLDEPTAWRAVTVVKLLTSHQRWFATEAPDPAARAYRILEQLLHDDEVQQFLHVNRYRDVLWFNKEAFEQLLWWLLLVAKISMTSLYPEAKIAEEILAGYGIVQRLRQAEEESGYQVEELMTLLWSNTQQSSPHSGISAAGE
jgi:hypothetical protein